MSPTAAGDVRERVPGEVLLPGDDGYDAARSVWNAMVDRRPAMIVRATSTADVAAAVRIGLERGLEIGVRCGGHGVLGLAVPDGGLMIDLRPMGRVQVDPGRRRATVQAARCSVPWMRRPSRTDWRPRPATSRTPVSVG